MSSLPTHVQAHIDGQCRLVETLLAQRQVVFEGRTVETTEEMGIYLLADRHTGEILYIGQTRKGVKSCLRDHWDGPTSYDLSNKLVAEAVVNSIVEGRAWIKDHVSIRWLTGGKLDTCIK